MDLAILDRSFAVVAMVDDYQSLIWTDRYNECGDFELVLPISSEAVFAIQQEYYLYRSTSRYLMVIETIKLESDVEEGDRLIVSGRSLESILERRVIWNQTVFSSATNSTNFQNAIRKLMYDNIIEPADSNRKILGITFKPSTDPNVTGVTVETQFDGEVLYDAVRDLCDAAGLGFRLLPDATFSTLVFELYAGQNRSYDQQLNPYMVFSPNYENLINSNYLSTTEPYRNTALVAGEGEGIERKKVSVTDSGSPYKGLDRREIFVDANNVSSETDDGTLSDAEYRALLEGKGYESLAENTMETAFDGEAVPIGTYEYGKDYFLGDIVQIENAYGLTALTRVTEYIVSDSEDGYEEYPTFTAV